MDSDFRPADGSAKSLQDKIDALQTRQTPAKTENFQTPDEVAAVDDLGPATLPAVDTTAGAPKLAPKSRSGWRDKLHLSWPPGQREWVGGVIVVVVCGSVAALIINHSTPKPIASAAPKTAVVKKAPVPTTMPSTLSGLPVAPSVNQKPVTGVMIENSTEARPQSGLSQAEVVFEAVAEGGVTRFLALYQDTAPANVGPIRSARPYYVEWALGFDAGYAHVGGSPDALADIKSWNVRDLDQFYNSGAYHRITTREAPHNVYTSIADLNQLEASKGYTSSTFSGFVRKAKEAPSKTPTAGSINLTLSGAAYNVHYDYNPATDSYNRSEGGAAQIDANTNTQISPKVVIAIVVPETQGALDSSGAYYSDYASIGSGTADIFQDGTVTTGTWTKASNTSQMTFTDSSGKPIGLNAGQTWITAISDASKVSYTP